MPVMADKGVYFIAPGHLRDPGVRRLLGDPVRRRGHRSSASRRCCSWSTFRSACWWCWRCSSVGVYGIVLGGWASGSTYPLLGGAALGRADDLLRGRDGAVVRRGVPLRRVRCPRRTSSAPAGSRAGTSGCCCPSFVDLRASRWSARPTGRRSTCPRPSRELVGGFHTEYSSLKFALFFLAEYVNMVTVSAMATTLFLGGWQAPWPSRRSWPTAAAGCSSWFLVKVFIFLFVFVWLRGTLPRLRYDQFMRLGWKVLVPLSLSGSCWSFALRTYRTVGSGYITVVLLTLGIVRRGGAGGRVPGAGPAPARGAGGRAGVGLPGAPAGSRGPRSVPAAPPRGRGGARPARPSSTSGPGHRRPAARQRRRLGDHRRSTRESE